MSVLMRCEVVSLQWNYSDAISCQLHRYIHSMLIPVWIIGSGNKPKSGGISFS